jgi:division protein CdvB (Snf7/Vps24/ESCRT-III family)
MEDTENRLTQKDKDMFNKCVNAQMAKQTDRAAMYANELAEIRKIAKLILRSQMALEQVELRLSTIRDFGDVAVTMAPVVGIVHAIRNQLMGVMPEVSYELGTIGETLNSLVVEAGDVTGAGYDIEASSEEATKILNEANAVAEQKMKERFPELPIAVPAAEREKARSP